MKINPIKLCSIIASAFIFFIVLLIPKNASAQYCNTHQNTCGCDILAPSYSCQVVGGLNCCSSSAIATCTTNSSRCDPYLYSDSCSCIVPTPTSPPSNCFPGGNCCRCTYDYIYGCSDLAVNNCSSGYFFNCNTSTLSSQCNLTSSASCTCLLPSPTPTTPPSSWCSTHQNRCGCDILAPLYTCQIVSGLNCCTGSAVATCTTNTARCDPYLFGDSCACVAPSPTPASSYCISNPNSCRCDMEPVAPYTCNIVDLQNCCTGSYAATCSTAIGSCNGSSTSCSCIGPPSETCGAEGERCCGIGSGCNEGLNCLTNISYNDPNICVAPINYTCSSNCGDNSQPFGLCGRSGERPSDCDNSGEDCSGNGTSYGCGDCLCCSSYHPPTICSNVESVVTAIPRSAASSVCTVGGQTGIETAIGCIPVSDNNAFLAFILRWAVGIAGGTSFILIIYSGFSIMTAAGDKRKLQAGKELLTAAIAGLLLLIFSVYILDMIGIRILRIPGLG